MKSNTIKVIKFMLVLFLGLYFILVTNAQCPAGDITLSNQTQVNNFSSTYPNCTDLQGNLTIDGGSINNLSGLSGITSIAGDLMINNTALQNVEGLNNLTSVKSLFMDNNNSMVNLNGFSSLTTIQTHIQISQCPSLLNVNSLSNITSVNGKIKLIDLNNLNQIDGLLGITSIGGNLNITRCHNLTDLAGLANLQTIGGQLWLNNNNGLTSLNGLDNLQSLSGNLIIKYHSNLSDISALSNLSSIDGGSVTIEQNSSLASLSGLDNIDPVTIHNLTIIMNSVLTECAIASVCGYLDSPTGSVNISNNMSDCGSRSVVEAACLLLPVDLIKFDVEVEEEVHVVIWVTASEENNLGFEIQRSSNGIDWDMIGFEYGAGTYDLVSEYAFVDERPMNGYNYYRLQQEDFDGTIVYSDVRVVEKLVPEVQVYPNPAQNELFFSDDYRGQVTIYNTVGAMELTANVQGGLNIGSLKGGLYFIQLENQDQTIRLVVE